MERVESILLLLRKKRYVFEYLRKSKELTKCCIMQRIEAIKGFDLLLQFFIIKFGSIKRSWKS